MDYHGYERNVLSGVWPTSRIASDSQHETWHRLSKRR